MAQTEGSEFIPGGVSLPAQVAWMELQTRLEEVGTVPCQTQDVSAWWPDRRELGSPATHGAIAACRGCPLRRPCAEYAIAADERFGVWGATLPDERRAIRRAVG
jgi:Transcription factor WhiB